MPSPIAYASVALYLLFVGALCFLTARITTVVLRGLRAAHRPWVEQLALASFLWAALLGVSLYAASLVTGWLSLGWSIYLKPFRSPVLTFIAPAALMILLIVILTFFPAFARELRQRPSLLRLLKGTTISLALAAASLAALAFSLYHYFWMMDVREPSAAFDTAVPYDPKHGLEPYILYLPQWSVVWCWRIIYACLALFTLCFIASWANPVSLEATYPPDAEGFLGQGTPAHPQNALEAFFADLQKRTLKAEEERKDDP